MSFEITVSGNLATDPKPYSYAGGSGLQFSLATTLPHEGIDEAKSTIWFDATVAGMLMRRAKKLKRSDGVWIRGHVSLKTYMHGNEERTVYKLHCNELITHNETYES